MAFEENDLVQQIRDDLERIQDAEGQRSSHHSEWFVRPADSSVKHISKVDMQKQADKAFPFSHRVAAAVQIQKAWLRFQMEQIEYFKKQLCPHLLREYGPSIKYADTEKGGYEIVDEFDCKACAICFSSYYCSECARDHFTFCSNKAYGYCTTDVCQQCIPDCDKCGESLSKDRSDDFGYSCWLCCMDNDPHRKTCLDCTR